MFFLDYLIAGKTSQDNIVFMSKGEFIAKNDDISNLDNDVPDLKNDEKGKNIVDYIVEYQSANVFKNFVI